MRNHDKPCQHCGEPIASKRPGEGKGRPALFCSVQCKQAARDAADSATRREKRAGRSCVQCDGPISDDKSAKAICCSHACAIAYQNRKKGQAIHKDRLAAREARRDPCGHCGGPIPVARKMGSQFCSAECVRKAMTEQRRETAKYYNREYLYGISAEQYDQLWQSQDGRCAICRTDTPGGRGGFHVDHCHVSGAVRGLLCNNCNQGLGKFADDPDRLRTAANYLTM